MKTLGTVYATTNYMQFALESTNAIVRLGTAESERHIANLAQNLADGHVMIPALVSKRQKNGKFVIIDGQQRFLACKKLGVPFVFVIQLDDISLQEKIRAVNNNMRPWKSKTHIESLAGWDHEDVIDFKQCAKEFGLGYSAFNALCTGIDNISWAGTTGEVPFDLTACRNKLLPLKEALGKKTRVHYVCQAIYRFLKFPNVNVQQLATTLTKIERDKGFSFSTTMSDNIDALIKKYNHGLPEQEKTYRIVK